MTGNGESKFGSGEVALDKAITSKDGSRRATYPMTERTDYAVVANAAKVCSGVEIVTRYKLMVALTSAVI